MKSVLAAIILAIMFTGNASSQSKIQPSDLAHTYSIVAYDPATGQFGAAVQSHWFRVANVIWAKAGVGAVATQSLVDYAYGPMGLEMMSIGKSAEEAMAGMLASDPNSDVRQVAMIDKNGIVIAHTGANCIAEAGHQIGVNYSCQANLMRNNTVWTAMATAFESTEGDLAERMMAALEAGEGEGGDIRGRQSAAMVVVTGEPTGRSWHDRIVDIRVDDSPEPLKELRRLLEVTRAYDWMNKGDDFMIEEKFEEAAHAYAIAAGMQPENTEILFWQAATLATIDKVDESLPIFKEVFKRDESWRILIPRLVKAGLLPDNSKILDKILEQ